MRFKLIGALLALFLALPVWTAAAEAPTAAPADTAADDLCTADYQMAHPGLCPLFGPGGAAERRRRYDLPETLAPLATLPLPASAPLPYTYAKVTAPDTPVYKSVADAVAGQASRTLGRGYIYVSYKNLVSAGGQEFIHLNNGEYVGAGTLAAVTPSAYQGIIPARQPDRPFGWAVFPAKPRLWPGGPVNPAARPLVHYDMIQIYGEEKRGPDKWYLIGRDQWVEQRFVGIVELSAPPAGVAGKWVSVNLFEQTMAVYEGSRLVYASLISSGLGAWPTRPGLYQVYKKMDLTNMSGAFARDRSDYYYVEDVPWVLYFDQSISFHGTYWHDKFGFQESHGCVNLSPRDAYWLYQWAELGTTVYVYDPSGRTPAKPWTGGGP